jgi:hypothetical protein
MKLNVWRMRSPLLLAVAVALFGCSRAPNTMREDFGALTRKPDAAEALSWLKEAKAPDEAPSLVETEKVGVVRKR